MFALMFACEVGVSSSRYCNCNDNPIGGFNRRWGKRPHYSMYSTSRVYVSCAGEFHTLRRRVVRRVYTIFLHARSKKMRDSCAFVIQCYKFPLYFIVVWNKGLLSLKKRWVDNGRFTLWKKTIMLHSWMSRRFASRIFRITCSSSRLMLSLLITNYIYDL